MSYANLVVSLSPAPSRKPHWITYEDQGGRRHRVEGDLAKGIPMPLTGRLVLIGAEFSQVDTFQTISITATR